MLCPSRVSRFVPNTDIKHTKAAFAPRREN